MIWSSLIAGLIIVFSFQNCQQSPHADEISPSNLTADASSSSKINLSDEKISQIDVVITEKESITRAGHTYDLLVNKTLQINLSSGVFQVVSDLGGAAEQYCLSDALKNELVSILKSSQICKTGASALDKACAQVIKPAYAQILTDVDQYDLGAANDSCGSNSADLCGDQAGMLKGYIAALKTKYKTLACSN